MLCAWDRMEAHAHARKLAAVAELARRNPGELDQEFTADQVAYALGESRARADSLIGMAQTLPARLPGTKAGLEEGTVSRYKAEIIAGATVLLEDDEARAAEAEVLDRAARLTPAGLRAAIARAVIKAAPKKAKERREQAARNARVERWLQDTGNAALMGCELPPAEALAADEQITARAKELRKAGLEGDMDQLRARAYLDLLLGKDSRPRPDSAGTAAPPPAPAGFAGRITLTVAAGHPGRPGGPARRAGQPGPGRPVAGPRPGRGGRGEPEDHVVPDRHRRPGARRRPRLRQTRTQEPEEPRRPRPAGRDRVLLHPGQLRRAARRVRHLAADHSRSRPGPDHHHRSDHHRPLRPPVRSQRP